MKEIHFDCSKCQRPMAGPEDLTYTEVTCPDCGEKFYPAVKATTVPYTIVERPAAETPQQKAAILQARAAQADAKDRDAIRSQAESFIGAAILTVVLGVVAIFIGIVGDGLVWMAYLGSGLVGIGCWCYLVAQIIHIRANTLK